MRGGASTESTCRPACSSGSFISGRSIRLSIGRPPRACQMLSYSDWTCSQAGCAGRSKPNRRRPVSALTTACWYSDFTTWNWTFKCRPIDFRSRALQQLPNQLLRGFEVTANKLTLRAFEPQAEHQFVAAAPISFVEQGYSV